MTSQITGVSIVYSIVCSGAGQRKHQSSASLVFVRGIHRWPVTSPHKGPVTRKMFPFDDVIMLCTRQGLYSLSGKTSYRKISWSLEAARWGFKLFQLLWNLAGSAAAEVPVKFQSDTTIATSNLVASRFGGKTSYRLVNRGPGFDVYILGEPKELWKATKFTKIMYIT